MRRRLFKLLTYLAILVILIAAVGYLLYLGPFQSWARRAVVRELETRTGLKATLDKVELHRGRVELRDLTLSRPDGTRLLTAPETVVVLAGKGLPLSAAAFRQVTEIRLIRPTARITREKSGQLDIASFFQRQAKAPRFRGRVVVQDGSLTFVDLIRGGATAAVQHANASYAVAANGAATFSLEGAGADGSLASAQVTGETDPKAGATRLAGTLGNLSLVYAQRWLPPIRGVQVTGGRGDLDGEVTFARNAQGRTQIVPNVRLHARGATVGFPWLRQPITSVGGEVRVVAQEVRLVRLAGSLLGSPVTAAGTVARTPKPPLKITFTVAGMRVQQMQALLPSLTLPSTLQITAPLRVEATVSGRAPELTVAGRAAVPEITLACLPWHDVVASFTWKQGEVTITGIRAHGSPRQLQGDVNVRWRAGQRETQASLVMSEVPIAMLVGCVPELKDLKVGGVATVSVNVTLDKATAATGTFRTREARYGQLALGELRGDFAMMGQGAVEITNGHVAGPTATADFSGTVTRGGDFDVRAHLTAVDLARLGFSGLTGTARGTLAVAGSAPAGRASGHAELSLTGVAGGVVREVTSDYQLTAEQVTLSHLVVQAGAGRATGELALTHWSAGKQAGMAGKLEVADVPVGEWLPGEVASLFAHARATGTITVGGTVGSPEVQADLELEAVEVAPAETGAAHVRLSYRAGELTIEELTFESPQGRLQLRGGYSRARGIDITIPEASTDLSVFSPYLRPLGITVSGPAVVHAAVQGQPSNPSVDFGVTSPRAEVNGVELTDLALAGEMRNKVLTLREARFKQGRGTVSVIGSLDLATLREDLHLVANAVDLAPVSNWLRAHAGLAVTGQANADVTARGTLLAPEVQFTLSSPAPVVNEVSFREVSLAGRLQGGTLTLDRARLEQNGGMLSLGGTVNLLTREMSITATAQHLNIYQVTLAFARAAERLHNLGTTDRPLRLYASIPGPFEGTLEGEAEFRGRYDNPQGRAHVVLDNLTYQGRSVDTITGDVTVGAERGGVREIGLTVKAEQGEASASVTGTVAVGGETDLRLEANDLDLKVLAPWLPGAAGLTGKAAVSADVTGRTDDPRLEGSVFATDVVWGPVHLEGASFAEVALRREVTSGVPHRVLSVGDIRLRNGPMEGTGRARVELPPLGTPVTAALLLPSASGELHVKNGRFVPIEGMTAAEFDADLYLSGQRLGVRGTAEGTPGPAIPGVRGRMAGGRFSVIGSAVLPESLTTETLAQAKADLRATLGPLTLDIPGLVKAEVSGPLVLRNDPETGLMQLATPADQPLVVSHGTVTVPPAEQHLAFSGGLPFAPELDIHIATGPGLRFHYSFVDAAVQDGTLAITGTLTPEKVQVHGQVRSTKGTLNFPNARLDLVRGTATIDRVANQPLTVRVSDAEAAGEVGDYEIVLRPSGQVYPPPGLQPGSVGLDLGARSTPLLDTPYIMALLMGPVISPAATGVGFDPFAVLTAATGPITPPGAITGIMIPGLVGQNLALDYSFEGPLSVRFRQRLFGRLYGQYITPISGYAETRRLALTYQVTALYSVGFSVNGLDQVRYQVQSFFTF